MTRFKRKTKEFEDSISIFDVLQPFPTYGEFKGYIKYYEQDQAKIGFAQIKALYNKYKHLDLAGLMVDGLVKVAKDASERVLPVSVYKTVDNLYWLELNFGQQKGRDNYRVPKLELNGLGLKIKLDSLH